MHIYIDLWEMCLPPCLLFIHLSCFPVCVSRGVVGDPRRREGGRRERKEGGQGEGRWVGGKEKTPEGREECD